MSARRYKARKRKRQRKNDENRLESTSASGSKTVAGELLPSDDGGDGVLTDPSRVRSDSRMAAKILSLGVVEEDVAKAVLKRAFVFAASAEDSRSYSASMRVILAAAKLENDIEKTDKPKAPHLHLHGHVDNANTGSTRDILAAIATKGGLHRLAERSRSGEFGGS